METHEVDAMYQEAMEGSAFGRPAKRTKAEIRKACEERQAELIRVIGMAAWWDGADSVLTADEREAVNTVWLSMPGSACWNDAFLLWMVRDA